MASMSSRFTHMNSSYYRFDEATHVMELFALRDIKAGDELSYSCEYSIQIFSIKVANVAS